MEKNSNLTNNFTLSEYCVSERFPYLVDRLYLSAPEGQIFLHAHLLLQPIRDKFRVPIKINAGYRDDELNRLVGGSTNSRHMLGKAADITVSHKDLLEDIFDWAKDHLKGRCGELIMYWKNKQPLFIHIALPRHGADNNRVIRHQQYK